VILRENFVLMGRASFQKKRKVERQTHPRVANSLVRSKARCNRVAAILISCGRDSWEKLMHDAHRRGQIAMLARQAGHPLPQKAMFGMSEWGIR
jgi:hypothetical protein